MDAGYLTGDREIWEKQPQTGLYEPTWVSRGNSVLDLLFSSLANANVPVPQISILFLFVKGQGGWLGYRVGLGHGLGFLNPVPRWLMLSARETKCKLSGSHVQLVAWILEQRHGKW